jgi:hypothetical protein
VLGRSGWIRGIDRDPLTAAFALSAQFFLFSALPLTAVPITFGCTTSSAVLGLPVVGMSAFVLGMIYYVGIAILDGHLKNADKAPKARNH